MHDDGIATLSPASLALLLSQRLEDLLRQREGHLSLRIRPERRSEYRLLTVVYGATETLRLPPARIVRAWSDPELLRAAPYCSLTPRYGVDLAVELFSRLARGDQPNAWLVLQSLAREIETRDWDQVGIPALNECIEAVERCIRERNPS